MITYLCDMQYTIKDYVHATGSGLVENIHDIQTYMIYTNIFIRYAVLITCPYMVDIVNT